MGRKSPSATELEWRSLEALSRLEGQPWKEVQGMADGAYGEIALWILLYEDSDLVEAHDRCRKVLAPFLAQAGGTTFTVSYMQLTETEQVNLAHLTGTEEILRAYGRDELGRSPHVVPRRTGSVFRSSNSRR